MCVGIGESQRLQRTRCRIVDANECIQRVVIPDAPLTVYSDTRDMRLCWARRGSHSRCGRGAGAYRHINVFMGLRRGIERANVTRKSLGIPDIAGAVRSDQVRYWTACTVNKMLFDRNRASGSGCETPNFLRPALCKPDRSSRILRDTVWQASSCCNSSLDKGFGRGIEEANFVCGVFGKPDIAIVIEDQVVWASLGCGYCPLLPGRSCFGSGSKPTDCIGSRLTKPDVPMRIKKQEHGAGEPRRLQEVFHQCIVRRVILADIGRESAVTSRFGVTAWFCDPGMITFIKSHSPGSGLRRRLDYPGGVRTG